MSTRIKEAAGGDFPQVPAGMHPAWCYGVVDIGLQRNSYQGEESVKQQVVLLFEIAHEMMVVRDVEVPMTMTAFYTSSLHPKARLRSDLESWRGRAFTKEELAGFDLKNLIGKQCTLSVFSNEHGKSRIKGIGSVMKGIEVPAMVNAPIFYDLEEHGVMGAEYDAVPTWLTKIIHKRVDNPYSEVQPMAKAEDFDDDIPF